MAKGCSWPFQQELLQGMPCCDLCVTVVLPSASMCVLVQLRGQSCCWQRLSEGLVVLGEVFELCKCKRRLPDEEKLGSSQRDSRRV